MMIRAGSLLYVFLLALVFIPSTYARELKIATIAPDGTTWMKEMRMGTDEISHKTNGRVTFKFYPGGVMGTGTTVLKKIRIGQLQGGALPGGELFEIYPDLKIYNIPFLFRSYDEVDYVRTRIDSHMRTGIENAGLVPVGLSEGGFAYLFSDQPVRSIDDLKGKKFWIPKDDVISGAVLASAGITPVPLMLADVYTSLQTGLIDTAAAPPTAFIAFQWHTKVKYMTEVPLAYVVGILVIDKKVFYSLSHKDQSVVREVMAQVFARLNELNRKDNEAAKQALQNQGIEIVTPSADEIERWRGYASDAITELEDQDIYSTELLKGVQDDLNDYRKQFYTTTFGEHKQ